MLESSGAGVDLLRQMYNDDECIKRIRASNVLLVGAGGIGCEVLKGLLLNGFPLITLVDLDTIDVSNLNRQFLYNKTHVGKSKAEVAAVVSVERFSHRVKGKPISTVKPIHDSILNLKYNKQFYNQFTFVINALDNNSTRVHVNRMCLSANIPLIESGSAGYFGNVKLILKGVTQCFECEPPKKDENTYASCTIRNTPSLPIHCIVWGKHLFAQLFGDDDEDISPDVNLIQQHSNNDNSESKSSLTTRQYVEANDYDPKALFDKIFSEDIKYLRSMTDLWKNRKEPRELNYDSVEKCDAIFNSNNNGGGNNCTAISNGVNKTHNDQLPDQKLWSAKQCLEIFVDTLHQLKNRLKVNGIQEWDKDDEAALNFVVAISNFRCHCFHIERKSKFDVKSLAGNIIPAISTTNTVVGGYILLQTMRLLQCLLSQRIYKTATTNDEFVSPVAEVDKAELEAEAKSLFENCFSVFISNKNIRNLSKIALEPLYKPKSDCMACSSDTKEILVALSFEHTSLADLVDKIVMRKFKCIAPDVNVFEQRKMLWSADDEDELHDSSSSCHSRMLSSYSFLTDDTPLEINDLEQDFRIIIRLRNMTIEMEEDGDGEFFKILNQAEFENLHSAAALAASEPEPLQQASETPKGTKRELENIEYCVLDEEDLVCLDDETSTTAATTNKRVKVD